MEPAASELIFTRSTAGIDPLTATSYNTNSMTPAGNVLIERIQSHGPVSFSEFMDCALYHPEHGYYRGSNIFGKSGDFYTAEQLQPVFGRLIAADIETHSRAGARVLELGAGRNEMAPYFQNFNYVPFDLTSGALPQAFEGVVFSNEFFDALPVDVFRGDREQRVGYRDGKFVWIGDATGDVRETQQHRVEWVRRIDGLLDRGLIYTIDYGYTRPELIRFPNGTLMSYRKHQAHEDVLRDPGTQDITAHVDFTALQEEGEKLGWRTLRFETLTQALLRAGALDNFESALQAPNNADRLKQQLQLKSLLFGLGETFQVLIQMKNGPDGTEP